MKHQQAVDFLVKQTRSIPGYPKQGIIFRDLTTIFQDNRAMGLALDLLSEYLYKPGKEGLLYDKLVGIESRGFVLAGGLAGRLGGGDGIDQNDALVTGKMGRELQPRGAKVVNEDLCRKHPPGKQLSNHLRSERIVVQEHVADAEDRHPN